MIAALFFVLFFIDIVTAFVTQEILFRILRKQYFALWSALGKPTYVWLNMGPVKHRGWEFVWEKKDKNSANGIVVYLCYTLRTTMIAAPLLIIGFAIALIFQREIKIPNWLL